MEESVSCRALLRPSFSGLLVFPAPQDPVGLGVSLGAEKSKACLCQTWGLGCGLVSLAQGFWSPPSVLGKSRISLSFHFFLHEMEMVKLALRVMGDNVGKVPDT